MTVLCHIPSDNLLDRLRVTRQEHSLIQHVIVTPEGRDRFIYLTGAAQLPV